MSHEERRDLEQFIAIMLAATIACVLVAVLGTQLIARGDARPADALVAERPAEPVVRTHVRVTLWARGTEEPGITWVVRCPGAAPCGALTRAALTERSGPCRGRRTGDAREALIEGTVAGRYRAEFLTRRDGCDRARWNALVPVLTPPGRARRA